MLADLVLSEEQKSIREAAREFAEREFPKYANECDREEKFPLDLLKKAAELGFVGLHIPEEYGGQGMGILAYCLAVEEFWRVDGGLGMILSTTFGSEMLLMFGSEEQKKKYLPPLARGEKICCACFTEPQAGSDIAGIRTRAEKDGDYYVLNGLKTFITNGSIADYYVVLARTDPNPPKRNQGMSVFIVERGTPGLEARKLTDKLGIRASDTAEVSFKDVMVPRGNIVGVEGDGFRQAMEFFNLTRIHTAFQAVGIAQGAFELAFEYSKSREAFEKRLVDFQAIREKLAVMRTKIEAARLLALQAGVAADRGKPDPGLTAMAKYFAARVAQSVVSEALQIHGGYGFMGEQAVSRMYRDVRVLEIYEGTREVEVELVARALLGGLPSVLGVVRKHPLR
ncbi:MAG: acyl-CoA dehydrogenase family protein [Candidatus Jordarchaeales archaeon]|nr:acyl-CoA dehydrogenase family protein [Candidatus Jordarchaeia archaeon]